VSTVLVLSSRKQRARKIAPGLASGIERCGDKVIRLWSHEYKEPCTDILVHYGFDGSRNSDIAKAFLEYVYAGLKAVYVDLGYFKMRRELGRYHDFHRFSINDRHPTKHFQLRKHPQDRADAVGARVVPKMRQGKKIIVCGMSPKASAFDYVIGWEVAAITEIKKHTDRPIVYRPKPQRAKNGQLPPIDGTEYSDPITRRLEHELADAWAVVSHHSNAGLDALCHGVPCFQPEGVASVLGYADLCNIEHPWLPSFEERRQLVNDVCYTQFNGPECASGMAWRHFKEEGLL
jgi:hypothetical protein